MSTSKLKHQAVQPWSQQKAMNHGNVGGRARTFIRALATPALRAMLVLLLGLGLAGELFAQSECEGLPHD